MSAKVAGRTVRKVIGVFALRSTIPTPPKYIWEAWPFSNDITSVMTLAPREAASLPATDLM